MFFFTFGCILTAFGVMAQNAPVTTLPVVSGCPGSVISVPVTVTQFNSIGSMSLTLKYNSEVLTYVSAVNNSGFPGMSFGHGTPGKIVIGGFSSSNAITYPDNTVLFTITFNYLGGTTALTWFDNGGSCEYGSAPPNYVALVDIPYENYYINGQVNPVLGVDFTADNLLPAINQTVSFSDLTTGSPSAWKWIISPANFTFVNGTTSGSQNPQVQLTSNGIFSVSLAATKEACTITKTKNSFLHSGTSGLWTGLTSTDWNTVSNWHNYTIPDNTVEVIIPESSVNWPVYNGDLTIGSECKTLKIEGSTSLMTVTGNLVIAPFVH